MSSIPALARVVSLSPRRLLHPSTLLVILSNLIPLLGVLLWQWDVFLLLMLFWLETAVIAFWTLLRLLALGPGQTGLLPCIARVGANLAIASFFAVHAGLFMVVHFMFLWLSFAGPWAAKVSGPGDFLVSVVLATGIWLPLLVSFLGRGFAFFHDMRSAPKAGPAGAFVPNPLPQPKRAEGFGTVVGGLYARIVTMHLVIIFGAILSTVLGTIAPFLLLLALKTAIDVIMHIGIDIRSNGVPTSERAPHKEERA